MIEFKKIRVKNFMSYGNAITEVDLRQGNVLVYGKNGHGKSSIWLDGITYALFGKPFRKINVPQLINSINLKDCQVEVDFSANQKEYTVKRGMKPGKFEIYEDSVLIKQEAAAKDYQGYLEKNILRINHKTFTQVLILGSAAFTPFMQQSGPARREIIEDILDIGVFSKMQRLLRDRITATREELNIIDVKIDSAKAASVSQQKLIATLSEKNERYNLNLIDQKQKHETRLHIAKEERLSLIHNKESLSDKLAEFDTNAFDDMFQDLSQSKRDIQVLEDKMDKISSLDFCPTCQQVVSEEHKHSIKDGLFHEIALSKPKLSDLETELKNLKEIKEARDIKLTEISNLEVSIKFKNKEILEIKSRISDLDAEISAAHNVMSSDITVEKDKLKALGKSAVKLIERKSELLQEKSLQEVAFILLKDNGIKASIVKEYLPLLNKLINKYLTEFAFFVNFELDETFSETIKSRGRDTFSYASFSEGEKKRIDLAILLAFRHIASMKNSAEVNLIVADEIDGGLDEASKEKFVELITGLGCNSWVISHVLAGTDLANQFGTHVLIEKSGDFSTVEIK